ncbi:hypothetical protein NDU88_004453 [Pleurodeles waltl]|uniref:Uncharacterized protein n=1 Tax=Pleurodeles waltl TaxID=8319 RepID=A0AAV7MTI1_PLEWA|nr:hypothetical protein NDU88_004453 [Pleurodeles waltl]
MIRKKGNHFEEWGLANESLGYAHPAAALHGDGITAMSHTAPSALATSAPAAAPPDPTMDCILQKIITVGHHLEGMDAMMTDLTEGSRSIRADIAAFSDRVKGMKQCLSNVEEQLNCVPDQRLGTVAAKQ